MNCLSLSRKKTVAQAKCATSRDFRHSADYAPRHHTTDKNQRPQDMRALVGIVKTGGYYSLYGGLKK
jgi:hypothetical protein